VSISNLKISGIVTGIRDSPAWADYPDLIGIGPLWFVAMLFTFSAGYVTWRTLTKDRGWFAVSASSLPDTRRIGIFVLALALVSFLLHIIVPLGESVNVFADFISFPRIAISGSISTFLCWVWSLPGAMGVVGFAAAALAFSGEWFSLELTPALENSMGGRHWQSAVYALWDSIFAVGTCLGLIPLFRRFFNGQG
jgi:glucan biosynthesis protein C